MSTATAMQPAKQPSVPAVAQPRLPYHPALKERFGVDQAEWRALVESTFPSARSVGAVILALAYCRARNLDPFKKTVHIVPIWDKTRKCEVETVWPGIAEYRTTAVRTAAYAGHDEVAFGPTMEQTWDETDKSGKKYGEVSLKFPEWAQMTVYRIVQGQRCAFPGPRVYWLETYASKKDGCPNSMWATRPIGMIAKCAEAAALRGAFPEEMGGEPTYEEWGGFRWHGRAAIDAKSTEGSTAAIAGPTEGESTDVSDTNDAVAPQADDSEPEQPQPEAATPEPQEEAEWLVEFADQLAQATTLNAANELRSKYRPLVSAAGQQTIDNRLEMRLAEIRGSRGGRANQKTLMGTERSATEAGA